MSGSNPISLTDDQLREAVRDRYAASAVAVLAELDSSGGCCGRRAADAISRDLYDDDAEEFSTALTASLGCGNPTALAALEPGQVVLDLGSGGGLDVLLSAKRVGPSGKAYGIDMTDEMLELARRNQAESGVTNAEFIQGTIEAIPLPGATIDVIISNCVINLSSDKDAVLREARRVLKSGGRFAVSDMVLLKPLPDAAMRAMALWTGCIAGALLESDYLAKLAVAGFVGAEIEVTNVLTRSDLAELAGDLPAGALPANTDMNALLDAMDGAVASAFIRANVAGDHSAV